MILILRAFLCLPLAGLSYLSFAQDYLKITPLTGEIDFDGMPVDQAWQSLQKMELKQHFPVFGSNPSEKNDVRIGYDRHYLWIGAIL